MCRSRARRPPIAALAVLSATLAIFAGQSNAVTFGVRRAELPPAVVVSDRVKIWDWKQQAFVTLRPGVNTHAGLTGQPDAWGPEVAFARRWLAEHPEGVLYVLKDRMAAGQTGLARDPAAWDWSPESRGEQYDRATEQARAAAAKVPDLDRVELFWMQGETDAVSPVADAAYGRNLDRFIARVRADWRVAGVHIARIADEWGKDSGVRRAQAARGAFSTDAYPMAADGRHFSAAGAVALGEGFYVAWRKAQRASAASKAR